MPFDFSDPHYRQTAGGESLMAGVATRSGTDLQLLYADGTRVTLQDYFLDCQDGAGCDVTLAGPDGNDVTLRAMDVADLTQSPGNAPPLDPVMMVAPRPSTPPAVPADMILHATLDTSLIGAFGRFATGTLTEAVFAGG